MESVKDGMESTAGGINRGVSPTAKISSLDGDQQAIAALRGICEPPAPTVRRSIQRGYQKEKATYGWLFLFGGPEGSRTPVRKPLDMTFFADSLSFEFPPQSADRQALYRGSPFVHDRLKGERPMHVYH